MTRVEQGRCLGEGEPWLLLAMFGHTLLPFINNRVYSIKVICTRITQHAAEHAKAVHHHRNAYAITTQQNVTAAVAHRMKNNTAAAKDDTQPVADGQELHRRGIVLWRLLEYPPI